MQTSVLQWLEDSAVERPDKLAIYDGEMKINYGDFRRKSIALAKKIIEIEDIRKGRTKQQPIIVFMGKSANAVISFMGVAYSGNFYSYIDTEMPEARIQKILEILRPHIVITLRKLQQHFEKLCFDAKFVFYDDVFYDSSFEGIVKKKTDRIIDTDLLYVYFTSGSSGIPKGVAGTHRNLINMIDWMTETFNISSEDSFGNQFPFSYTASVLDIYSCIKSGASLFIIDKVMFSQPVKLLEYIKKNDINTLFWVPSALEVVSRLKALRNVDLSCTLKRVLFIGEVMPNKQLNIWRQYLPDVKYVNVFGSTEISVGLYYIVDRDFKDDEILPLGFPIPNVDVLVLDENDEPVQGENSGELCIRGAGLAAGYYGEPDKTKKVFIQNPMNSTMPDIICRTGDYVKINSFGELIYLSRKDSQIKHLGHRIELGEIERAVSSIEEVENCCCLYDDIKQCIVLFIDISLKREYIYQRISKLIPSHMFPDRVIVVDHMPLNENGKIDRNKLKAMLL